MGKIDAGPVVLSETKVSLEEIVALLVIMIFLEQK